MSRPFTAQQKQAGRSSWWKTVFWITEGFTYDDLCSVLENLQVPCCSILHDKDVFESDMRDDATGAEYAAGELKKLHAHVIFRFDSLKSAANVNELLEPVTFAYNGYVEKCIVPSACQRYMCHLDSPDKAQYQIEDVRCFGGFVYEPYKKLSPEAKAALVPEIIRFIEDNEICSYAHLVKWAAFSRPELIPVVMKDFAFGFKTVCESVARRKGLRDSADLAGCGEVVL